MQSLEKEDKRRTCPSSNHYKPQGSILQAHPTILDVGFKVQHLINPGPCQANSIWAAKLFGQGLVIADAIPAL